MLLTYLNTLKTKGNFTIEEISNLSGIPEATVFALAVILIADVLLGNVGWIRY